MFARICSTLLDVSLYCVPLDIRRNQWRTVSETFKIVRFIGLGRERMCSSIIRRLEAVNSILAACSSKRAAIEISEAFI